MELQPGVVCICANSDQIPDEACPLAGTLRCDGAEETEIRMDGRSTGPVLLRPSRSRTTSCCIIPDISFDAQPPQEYTYIPKDPSPLEERHRELGGCELQRLMHCPTVIGFLHRGASNLGMLASPPSPSQLASSEMYVDRFSPAGAGPDHYQNLH
eukprot:TRINITY_DN10596_c0_g2_i4.p1 TRINITY_DN10596_c0_g2~~TRINITY_DN10596_c0_g2_i4.p1  ORF type:complete len:155 (-),score=15.94 TRINITY_DN10596_c0_g2_i4:658-1122(-)